MDSTDVMIERKEWITQECTLRILELFNDEIAIINNQSSRMIWASSTLQLKYPGLNGSKLKSLYSIFPKIQEALTSIQINDADNMQINTLAEGERSRNYHILIVKITQYTYLLRMFDKSQDIKESQRFVKDREKLFAMSSTFSISEIATTLAHELNQPIGTLNNLLEGIKNRIKSNKELLEAVEIAQQQTKYAAIIISRIRDYTRRKRPEFKVFNVNELIQSAVSLLDWDFRNAKIICQLNLDASEVKAISITGDFLMLQQVLINLLRNAIDAMEALAPSEGKLKLELKAFDQFVEIRVIDNGVGLGDMEDSLFLPFNTSKPEGMGIGLNICRSFIELHQGKLWLESNTASGCSACIRLPIVHAEKD